MSTDSPNPDQSPEPSVKKLLREKKSTSWVEAVMVLSIMVVLIALFRPSMHEPRGDTLRKYCKNNLKQIGLGLHCYHDVYGSFPPAVVVDSDGRPMHSWRVLILPFMDYQALYDKYQFDEPWDGPRNSLLHDQMPDVYGCPAFAKGVAHDSLEGQHLSRLTNYVAIVAPGAVFDGATPSALHEVCDPRDHTLAVAEVCQHAVNWLSPQDVTPAEFLTDLRRSVSEANANHVDGLHTLRADGSVRFVPHDLTVDTLNAAVSKNGGEQLPNDFY